MSNVALLDDTVAAAFYGEFSKLRNVQESTIDPIIANRNVVLTSATGSGKTEAVMAPMVGKYWRQAVRDDSLFLLYISPTKALANDLEKRLLPPLTKLHLRVGIRHGDRDDLKSGNNPHILITTPESLDVMLARKDQNLKAIKSVVMDEVHLLYNTQRGLQLSILLSRLSCYIGAKFQWAALSATIGDLSYVRDFIMGGDSNADFISFPSNRAIDAQIRHAKSLQKFVQLIRRVTDGRDTKLLIFTNSRHECEKIAGALQEDEFLSRCVVTHYSSLSKQVRLRTEQKFASMQTAICVATSTLELGIDIGDIDAVILWGVPSSVDSFLQRIGRGNRRSHKTNVLCTIPTNSKTPELDALRFLVLLDSSRRGRLPVQEPYSLWGAIAQQCLSIINTNDGGYTRIADIHSVIAKATDITRDKLESILGELATNGFIQKHGYKNRYGADERLYQLVDMRLIYGNFPIGSDLIDIFEGSRHLGQIPKVNLLFLRQGSSFRFAGKHWRIEKIDDQGIKVENAGNGRVTDEVFFGMGGCLSQPYLTNYLWRLIHSEDLDLNLIHKDIKTVVSRLVRDIGCECSYFNIPCRNTDKGIVYYTFAGHLVNKAIGNFTSQSNFCAENITLTVDEHIDWESIPAEPIAYERCFSVLYESTSEQSYYQKQLPLEIQADEYIQSWLKDISIGDILTRLSRSKPVKVGQGTRIWDSNILG